MTPLFPRIATKALQIAVSQLGVRERGNNDGPEVREYLAAVGLPPGNPWCAAFDKWAISRACQALGLTDPFPKTGYCPTIGSWAYGLKILHSDPLPGDVFLLRGATRYRHTGFVTRVQNETFSTCEGNTNLNGSPEGIGVFARTRPRNPDRYRFVRWWGLFPDPHAAGDVVDERGPAASGKSYGLILSGRLVMSLPIDSQGHALAPVRAWFHALGFNDAQIAWDQQDQAVLVNGHELDADLSILDGTSYAPVRDLAQWSGLKLAVDNERQQVVVTR